MLGWIIYVTWLFWESFLFYIKISQHQDFGFFYQLEIFFFQNQQFSNECTSQKRICLQNFSHFDISLICFTFIVLLLKLLAQVSLWRVMFQTVFAWNYDCNESLATIKQFFESLRHFSTYAGITINHRIQAMLRFSVTNFRWLDKFKKKCFNKK